MTRYTAASARSALRLQSEHDLELLTTTGTITLATDSRIYANADLLLRRSHHQAGTLTVSASGNTLVYLLGTNTYTGGTVIDALKLLLPTTPLLSAMGQSP